MGTLLEGETPKTDSDVKGALMESLKLSST